jgi:HSP20 family protein
MAREMIHTGRPMIEWPPRWTAHWPTRWTDLFDDDGFIRVEEEMEDNTLVIRAELPGVDPDKDVQVTVENGVLTVHAERRDQNDETNRQRHRSEFRYGSFSRSVVLPTGATEDDVKATFTDGILEVRVPIDTTKEEPKTVPVTRT